MSNVPANQNDHRTRMFHQGYVVTTAGVEKTAGVQGVNSLMTATYAANFEIEVPEAAGTYLFNLPPHLYGSTFSIINAPGGTATMTLTKLDNGAGDLILAAAATDISSKANHVAFTNDYLHDNNYHGQETIELILAGAPASKGTLVLHLNIAQSGWK